MPAVSPNSAHGRVLVAGGRRFEAVAELGVDAEQQARDGRRHVGPREDVGELVRHDRLQLRARQPRQGALRDPDHPGALQVAERERVHAQRRDGHALDPRRPAREAHLLDDVGEALMVAVVRVERPAVHGAQEALARPDARHVPVDDREDQRRTEDHAGVAPVEDDGEDLRVRDDDEDRKGDHQARDPDGRVHEHQQEGEQQPDAPALLPLDLEDGLARRLTARHVSTSQLRRGVPGEESREKDVSTVETVVTYRLYAGVPLHTRSPCRYPPRYHPMAPFTSPSPPRGCPKPGRPPRPFGLPGSGPSLRCLRSLEAKVLTLPPELFDIGGRPAASS